MFALAAGMAGFAGGLLGMYRGTAGEMDFQMLVGIPFLLLLVVGGVGTVSGALLGGVSTVILLIVEQDQPNVIFFGYRFFAALTRIGPGLAALGASRNPEGIVASFRSNRPCPLVGNSGKMQVAVGHRRRPLPRPARRPASTSTCGMSSRLSPLAFRSVGPQRTPPVSSALAVERGHVCGRVPLAGDGVGRKRRLDRGEVVTSELDPCGLDRLGQALRVAGADQRHDVVAARQRPRDRQLGDVDVLGRRDRREPVDEDAVAIEVLALEPWAVAAEVVCRRVARCATTR